MPVTDPISDMLTRIRNAIMVHHDSVSIPASKLKESLLKLMREEGFIKDFVKQNGESKEIFEVNLRAEYLAQSNRNNTRTPINWQISNRLDSCRPIEGCS